MNSFIDLLGKTVWSATDITQRTEAMIASEFPQARLAILTRKVQGQAMGYVLTAAEQADLQAYQMACYTAGALADAARVDMGLLTLVLAYEAAVQRLQAEPVLDSEEDAAARADAQAVIDAATPEVLALYELRHPVEALPDAVQTAAGEA